MLSFRVNVLLVPTPFGMMSRLCVIAQLAISGPVQNATLATIQMELVGIVLGHTIKNTTLTRVATVSVVAILYGEAPPTSVYATTLQALKAMNSTQEEMERKFAFATSATTTLSVDVCNVTTLQMRPHGLVIPYLVRALSALHGTQTLVCACVMMNTT